MRIVITAVASWAIVYDTPNTKCKQTSAILTHIDPLGYCTRHVTH